ncbi:hypothetical protein OHB14_36550 [Streptomyces sp. NBC_01613]|uniref:hypothetical protein n=1 Tax=Streptomyces sp. NBC_01613 TaxID=2975896 RepID=UPI0038653F08
MTDRSTGPACGNNPNFRMSDGDRKAIDDFKARLALQAAAKPYIDRAVWVDGDPLMEVIAVTLWEHCARDDERMPQLVRDDPRTIAAFAAAVARAHAAVSVSAAAPPTDRASCPRCQHDERTRGVLQLSTLEMYPPDHADDCPAGLRDRLAAALLARIKRATVSKAQPHDAFTSLLAANEFDLADAVLAVLPPAADRAAVLREAADTLAAEIQRGARFSHDDARQPGLCEAVERLRRLAAEAPEPATQAEAHEPENRWRVEILDGETWIADSRAYGARSVAAERYQSASENAPSWADGQPVQRRLVRETTTHTVEDAPAVVPAVGQTDEEASRG